MPDTARSAELKQLLGQEVRVTSPGGVTWIGRLVAVVDEPCIVIGVASMEHAFGVPYPGRITLPQTFDVEPVNAGSDGA